MHPMNGGLSMYPRAGAASFSEMNLPIAAAGATVMLLAWWMAR